MNTSKWHGTAGRLEVWYTTLTDPTTGTGFWFHSELVAPTDGAPAFVHGWAAVFPLDAAPTWERFGPTPVDGAISELLGATAEMSWDLRLVEAGGAVLYTFPKHAWDRGFLPAAQVVPSPAATYDGTVKVGDQAFFLSGARGASARIYGHGSAKRWGWLHADLGRGDVLEIVTAVSVRPGLRVLPPLTFLQLRVDGQDLPRNSLLGAPLFRASLGLPEWRVRGIVDPLTQRRIDVRVTQDPERSVVVGYTDPDGATATCHNSEVATAEIRLERLGRGGWRLEREWRLDRCAHAEIGVRP